jgi:hypothetical protein
MRMFKLLVALAVLVGGLWWLPATAEASGCCIQDCNDAYGVMVANGVPGSAAWLRECHGNCEAHGDPSTCPLQGGAS